MGKRKPLVCSKRGCRLSEAAHRRQIEHIEETIGPRAADDWALEHRPKEDPDA